jgi:hypothetical protein
MNMKIALIGSAVLASCLLSATAFATGGGGTTGCSVTRESGTGTVFYVPRGGDGIYNILGWGNGTGGSSTTYRGLLEAAAARCVLVAAATTANSGSGAEVQSAVTQALSRYRSIVGATPKICTSGHSQGGGGSFNAANRLAAQCVIAVQPDTVYTTSILRPVASTTDVVCIFSTGDTLAPALPFNAPNCRANSTRYTQETTSGTHFAPTSGDGGAPGRVMREYIDRWML